ncbi:MAG: Crp/Fnr family transcriptional regulator [Bacteroidia bacterium]|nr:Crp/Fnr family transcriptional regulator [Bacteroidia bacterium]
MSVSISKDLIPALSNELRRELQDSGTLRLFKPGDIILKENTNIRAIPIVISGSLKVMREEADGREILLYYINPGESCIMSLFGGLHNGTSLVKAIAEEDTEILMFPVNKVGEWIRKYPDWIDFILFLYHKRFEELIEIVDEMAFQKTDERVLSWLRKKASNNHSNDILTTHQQIASELGTSREVVSRLLKQLEKEGLIELHRNKISLK